MARFKTTKELEQRVAFLSALSYVVLKISVPKDNDKKPGAMESVLATLHGIYRANPLEQEHISLELVARKDAIAFYIFLPMHLRELVEGQLYAQYPNLKIEQVTDYTVEVDLRGTHVATSGLSLTKDPFFPINTYSKLESDPLAGITAVMTNLNDREQVWFQMVIRPVGDGWQEKGIKYVEAFRKTGKAPGAAAPNLGILPDLAIKGLRFGVRAGLEILKPGAGNDDMTGIWGKPKPPAEVKLSEPQQQALSGVEEKVKKLGYETLFRLVAIATTEDMAKARLQAFFAAFKQYNTSYLNGFAGNEITIDHLESWERYLSREFESDGAILNIEELASVYHFPSTDVVETNAMAWSGSKKSEPPLNLPLASNTDRKILTVLGMTDYRNNNQEFGIKLDDRMRHLYVIGKSGSGKSTLLENMIYDDIQEGRGVIVVDPHGDLAEKTLEFVPQHRVSDVIYMDPADREFPIGFNLLDEENDAYKGIIASGFVGVFKKIFGNSWGPRLEYIMRNTVLALLDTPGTTTLSVVRMLNDPGFRRGIVVNIKDSVVAEFWKGEWERMDQKMQVEAVAPILNKVGQFVSAAIIRNIVGQPRSTFDMRRAMDEQKIVIVNLSKGKIGEDNAALLGTMLITKVQLAAMSRANVPQHMRPPVFLYVDEFQNFVTDSFAEILSEARKYNLGLVVAHQYIDQMTDTVRSAVFGNVGTLVSFRVGPEDASVLAKDYAPVFAADDLVNLERGAVYIKQLVDGLAVPAFSARTHPPRKVPDNFREEVLAYSRAQYAIPRDEAEAIIEESAGYKAKREAEAAREQAQAILTQNAQASAGQGVAQHSSNVPAATWANRDGAPQQPVLRTEPVVAPVAAQPVMSKPPVSATVETPRLEPQKAPASVAAMPSKPSDQHHIPAGKGMTLAEALAAARAKNEQSTQGAPKKEGGAELVSLPTSPAVEIPTSIPQLPEVGETVQAAPAGPVFNIPADLPSPVALAMQELLAEQQIANEKAAKKKNAAPKPPRIMRGMAYREVSQRGGMRWYLGEPEADYQARMKEREEKMRLKEEVQAQAGQLPSQASQVTAPEGDIF